MEKVWIKCHCNWLVLTLKLKMPVILQQTRMYFNILSLETITIRPLDLVTFPHP